LVNSAAVRSEAAPVSSNALPVSTREATVQDVPLMRRLAASSFDLEPTSRAALVDLLFHRPPADPSLRLVAIVDDSPVGFAFGSVHDETGYLDGLAVDEAVRRRGVGTALLDAIEDRLSRAGAEHLAMGRNSWFYAWPGVDLGYTAALCFAERRGYRRVSVVQNMDVSLDRWVPGRADEVLDRHGRKAMLRRGNPADWPALETFVREQFTEVWCHEARLALHRETPTIFIASRDDRVTGLACHGVYRPDWFGPLAVDPASRGEGLGEALLLLCLDDLAAAGVAVAQIGWIGPMSFYAKTVDARCGRVFAVLEKSPVPVPTSTS
jgi:predicted N-acetyltransferase YhbS